METSHSLAIESFSYSWLSNVKSDNSQENTSKELDYKILKEAQNFDFDIPTSPATLLHADELFSDGLIKPVSVDDPSKIEASNNTSSDLTTISPASSSLQNHFIFFVTWRKSSKRIFHKCFGYLRSFCHKVTRSSRKSNRVKDIDRGIVWEVKSWSNSPQTTPRRSTAYSVDDLYEFESSIHEAILHCKRSIEK